MLLSFSEPKITLTFLRVNNIWKATTFTFLMKAARSVNSTSTSHVHFIGNLIYFRSFQQCHFYFTFTYINYRVPRVEEEEE